MTLGEKLYELRKEKRLSQEEVAGILNVTRQTVSKWETDQSTPDFDKVLPLCNLYQISPNELFGKTPAVPEAVPVFETAPHASAEEPCAGVSEEPKDGASRRKKAVIVSASVVVYILAVSWMVCSIPFFHVNPILSVGIFLLIIAVGVAMDIFAGMAYKEKSEKAEPLTPTQKLQKQIKDVLAGVVLVLYLLISFLTGDWHITWMLWVIYAVVCEIIKLVFMLKEESNE